MTFKLRKATLKPDRQHGFTMVELVVAISISSVVLAFSVIFLTAPMDTYLAQNRRGELNYSADSALRMLGNDVRRALPYSLRTQRSGSVVVIEMLLVSASARFRVTTATGTPARELDFAAADDEFDTLGAFPVRPAVIPHLAVINNLGNAAADVYALPGSITTGLNIEIANGAIADEDHVKLTPAFKFAADSPTHHAFLVSGPVAYLCDEIAHTLTRYINYSMNADLNSLDSAADLLGLGATGSTVANNVSACESFRTIGLPQQNDLLSVTIEFESNNERLRIFKQFAVAALP